MARTTKEQAQKTRAKIIDTAIDVFYERGVPSTTLEHIAEAAGLTRGAIYWHFKNKFDLVSAVHDHFHISLLENINRELSNPKVAPLERIRTTWRFFLHSIANNNMYRKILTIFVLRCDYSGEMAALLSEQSGCKANARNLLANCFQAAIDSGDLEPTYDSVFLAQTHMCYMHGIIREYLAFDKLHRLKKEADALINFYFRQLPIRQKENAKATPARS